MKIVTTTNFRQTIFGLKSRLAIHFQDIALYFMNVFGKDCFAIF